MIFRQALHEGDGEVDKHQLPLVIKTLGYLLCDKQAIQKISEEITHYGTLDFQELLKFIRMYSSFERAKWQAHFDKFDEDKSGEVSMDELKLVLIELGYTPLPEMLDEAMKEVDSDGSGSINLHEFMTLMVQYRETQGFTREELDSLQDLFDRFDRDEDEQLNSTDIYHLKRYLGLKGAKLEEDADMRPLGWNGYLAEMRRYYEAEITFFRKEFEAFDADKSGHINTKELMDVLQNLGFTPLKNMLDEVIAIVDKDGSNELDFFEFNRMMWHYRRSEGFTHAEIAELAEVFDRHDKDKSGEISIMELGDILRFLGHTPKLRELQTLVEEFDVDGSGDVGLREFLKIMRRFREKEVKEFKFVFEKYDKDKSGSLATQEIAKVLRFLGREVSMPIVEAAIAEVDLDGSGELDWNEFVVLMDKYRKMDVSDKRQKCGFHDAQIFGYKTKFQAVDKDGSNDLSITEITKLLTDLNMAPRTPEEQSHVAQLLEECRNLAEEHDGKTTFWVFLRLMRFLEDEKDRNTLTLEQNAIEESKFSKQEVNEFREIFLQWASNDAKRGLPGASKCGKALGPEGMLRMLRSMGMTPTADDKEQLFKMVEEADQDGNGNVDFPDFLILMRRLMDANFCGLNQATEEAATKESES
jgi:Ca2+-binding EF-hand superfamily protein